MNQDLKLEIEVVFNDNFKVISKTAFLSLICALGSPEEFPKNSHLGSIPNVSNLVDLRYTLGTWSFRSFLEIQCTASVENHGFKSRVS